MALVLVVFVQSRELDNGGSSFHVSSPLPTLGSAKAQALQEEIGERCLGTDGSSRPESLQLAVSVAKGIGGRGRGCHSVVDLSSLNGYDTLTKFKIETISTERATTYSRLTSRTPTKLCR